jgi:hypothetical protein
MVLEDWKIYLEKQSINFIVFAICHFKIVLPTIALRRIEQCHREAGRPLIRLRIWYPESAIRWRWCRHIGPDSAWCLISGRTGALWTGRTSRRVTEQPSGSLPLRVVVVIVCNSGVDSNHRSEAGRPFTFHGRRLPPRRGLWWGQQPHWVAPIHRALHSWVRWINSEACRRGFSTTLIINHPVVIGSIFGGLCSWSRGRGHTVDSRQSKRSGRPAVDVAEAVAGSRDGGRTRTFNRTF